MLSRIILCVFFVLSYLSGQAQTDKTDSLCKTFVKDYQNAEKIRELLYFISESKETNIFFRGDDALLRIVGRCYENTKYEPYLPEAQRALGYYYIHKKKYELGLEYLKEAISIYQKRQSYDIIFQTWYRLVVIFYNTKDYANATKYSQNVEKYVEFADLNNNERKFNILNFYNMKGLIAHEENKYLTAIAYFEQALQLAQKLQKEEWVGILTGNLGMVYYSQKDYDKALIALEKDIALSLKNKLYASAFNAQCAKAEIFLHKNNLSKASVILDSVQMMMQIHIKNANLQLTAYKVFAKYYKAKKDFAKAFDFQEKVTDMESRRKDALHKQTITRLEAQFEYTQGEQKIREKHKDLENIILYYYLWGTLSISLLAILIVFTLFLWKMRKQQRTIKNKNSQLKEIVNVQEKMFSIIGHDLRNPIGNLKALLDLFKAGSLSQAEFMEISKKLGVQVEYLYDTMNDLLLWASAQMQNQESQPVLFDLLEPAQETVNFYVQIAEQKGVHVHCKIEKNTVIFADKNQIKIILRNLLSNAIKFTPKGGIVSIHASHTNDSSKALTVEDTGQGMSKEEVGKLFNVATHFSKIGTNNEKGTGLGLLLVKEYVEANQGKVEVHSEQNKGTKFVINLPTKMPVN